MASEQKKSPLLYLGYCIVILVVRLALSLIFYDSHTNSNLRISLFPKIFENMTVTESDITYCQNTLHIDKVILKNCYVEQAALERISKCEYLKEITLKNCWGFETLEPLSHTKRLQDLTFEYDDTIEPTFSELPLENNEFIVDGEALFRGDFSNIKTLNLKNISFQNGISSIENLSAIQYLTITDCKGISDVSFLKRLSSIHEISFSGIDLSGDKVNPLGSCTHLWSVKCINSHMDNLNWVRKFNSLNTLKIPDAEITDITPLSDLTGLSALDLSGNHIDNLDPIKPFDLYYLNLSNMNLVDIPNLENAVSLTRLILSDNVITNITPLENMQSLQTLDISNNSIADISSLAKLTEMKQLNISNNMITDISAIENMPQLETLIVSNNKVQATGELEKCPKLEFFIADNNEIDDLGKISGANLIAISLKGNHIKNIDNLSFKGIMYLDLSENELTDIPKINTATFKSYSAYLLLNHNKITNINNLPDLSYEVLALHDNPIENFHTISSWSHSLTSVLSLSTPTNETTKELMQDLKPYYNYSFYFSGDYIHFINVSAEETEAIQSTWNELASEEDCFITDSLCFDSEEEFAVALAEKSYIFEKIKDGFKSTFD